MKLYEIESDFIKLQEMAESEDIDEETLKDTMDAIVGNAEYKLESYAKIIKNLEHSVKAYKEEVARMEHNKKVIENRIDWLKFQIFSFMKETDMKKIDGEVFKLSIAKNGGKLPVIIDVDVEDIPDDAVVVTKKPNNTKIAEMLDAGTCNFAHFGERGEHLNIR